MLTCAHLLTVHWQKKYAMKKEIYSSSVKEHQEVALSSAKYCKVKLSFADALAPNMSKSPAPSHTVYTTPESSLSQIVFCFFGWRVYGRELISEWLIFFVAL